MGFAASKNQLSESNAYFTEQEDSLSVSSASAKAIDLAVAKYTTGGVITLRGMEALKTALNIKADNNLLEQFKGPDSNYNPTKVNVFLQVTSRVNVLEKSTAIYDCYDTAFSGVLSKAQVTEMFRAVVESAIGYGNDVITKAMHQQWRDKLKQRVATLVNKYTEKILSTNTEISREEFLLAVRNNSEVTGMLMARQIRADLESTTPVQDKQKIADAFANFGL